MGMVKVYGKVKLSSQSTNQFTESTKSTHRVIVDGHPTVTAEAYRRGRRTTISDGGAWTAGARTAKLAEARTASSELRLRRGRCLWLRLDERNTMVALHAQHSQQLGRYC
ncbi:hypothetical protein F2Q69_00002745 [Brassica cretica]|uniref:Uncharacterized protein n=1 Tax=Brassica cretica TaxID=69181 RepID=A0A8S9NV58_BRACR|nr:hypothetical protein F2Q69_00002745 [Brassica cretica]